jgi:hypothetical protein
MENEDKQKSANKWLAIPITATTIPYGANIH